MGFAVEKVLGQVFLRVLRFLSPLGVILPISLLRVLGDKLPVLALTAVRFKTSHAIENGGGGEFVHLFYIILLLE
jgi:hypothetical protein